MRNDLPDLRPDRAEGTPIYLQLYARFRRAIAQGQLRPGDRVPAVRALASELNLARGTVEAAYQLLVSEGYLMPRGPAGTVVSPQLATHAYSAVAPEVVPQTSFHADVGSAERPLQLGLPALDAFPRALWTRLAARRLRSQSGNDLAYPNARGDAGLREAIAAYLGVSRGIACSAQQVFITAGHRGSLDLICRTLLEPGDACWFEDPGYPHARLLLEGAGARLVPLPVDGEGLRVDVGLQRAANARFAVVTPSHQSPLGVSLSLPRRLALLDWANAAGAWVIEDDYDSEYRYQGRPLPALKSLDRQGRVLYAGTFSKVLFPGLRLAYLVVPESQVARFVRSAEVFQQHCPALSQATVADFLTQGHFARHLRRMRNLYALRRGYLTDALHAAFGDRLRIDLQAGGIQLLAQLDAGEDDRALAERINACGIGVHALSNWTLQERHPPGLLMGFTNLASAEQARDVVARMKAAMQSPTLP
ncbi:PLP-dependent aminotransferase family protein [Pseudomonas kuykendallii]|uniref:Transcriptional regulator, GntR family n=1 Tax=Pseudomonas kuykendallii TaxID=1007099 RepID=A0A1H2R5M5_9PSED|nr:PLP-dependent aminotransferase family protein [Pseudomonas kuykendallii]MCQ4271607.1 PLP-dependent aminotransferase family protein [Pseudomonas kuykendallii]SDW14154.1 transcriptional regulator, GntR family [Pseudomonas kuykendallii]